MRGRLLKELKNSIDQIRVAAAILSVAVAFVLMPARAHGQFVVTGSVTGNGEGLPGASVMLLSTDSSLVNGVVTDSTGRFTLQKVPRGRYLISVSMIGYARYYLPAVRVENDLALPSVVLIEEAQQLNEIVVKVMRDPVINKPDRLVVNLENSATSSGNTVLEVLQKSPGIVVDRQSNTIRINGRSGVTVTINGKPVQLTPDALVLMLDGMSAAGIKSIEIISSPGASADAEGSGGLINLVMAEQTETGTNVTMGLVAGVSWAETLGGNFSLVHKTRKVTGLIDYAISRRHNLHEAELTESSSGNGFEKVVNSNSHRENLTLQQNLRAGVEWSLQKTTLSLGLTAYRRDWNLNAVTDESSHAAPDSTTTTNIGIVERNLWQSVTASATVQRRIREKAELNAGLNYLYYHNHNPSHYRIASFFEQGNSLEKSEIALQKATPIRFIVSRVDYNYSASPFLKIETGFKSVASTLDNQVTVQRRVNEAWVPDPNFTSSSILKERIYASYISLKWSKPDRYDFTSGIRFEYTDTEISAPVKRDAVIRKYGYFFPNFSARRSFGPEHDIQLSYGRRIVRPGYNDIAPFVFFWGVRSFSAGNTKLFPAVADALSASYHLRQWNLSLHYAVSRNEIVAIQPERDDQYNLIYRSQNLEYLKTVGLTNSYTKNIFSRWTIQANITLQYQIARSAHLPVNFRRELRGVNAALMSRLTLPRNFIVEVSATYQSRFMSGISEYQPIGSLNAGIQKSFAKNGTLQLAMDDILYTNYWKISTDTPGNNIRSGFVYDWHNQYVRLTYTRSLGRKIGRVAQKDSGAEEERRRVD